MFIVFVARNSGKSKFLKGLAGVDAWRSKRPPSFCQRFSNTWKLSGSVFALSDQSSILRREWRMEDEWDFLLYKLFHTFSCFNIFWDYSFNVSQNLYYYIILTNMNDSMSFLTPKTIIMIFSRSARFHGGIWGSIASDSPLKIPLKFNGEAKTARLWRVPCQTPSLIRVRLRPDVFFKKHPVQWREKLFKEKSSELLLVLLMFFNNRFFGWYWLLPLFSIYQLSFFANPLLNKKASTGIFCFFW